MTQQQECLPLVYVYLTDAVVAMIDTQLYVTEGQETSIDVCVTSGIIGNIERDLIATLEINDGTASKKKYFNDSNTSLISYHWNDDEHTNLWSRLH